MSSSFLEPFVEKIIEARLTWNLHPFEYEPDQRAAARRRYMLRWDKPSADNLALKSKGGAVSIEEAREIQYNEIVRYLESDEPDHILLVSTAPGGGKSTQALMAAQDMARERDMRGLWVGLRHNYFTDDLSRSQWFDPELWYHWRPTHGKTDAGEDLCRYAPHVRVWAGKGYPVIKACMLLCQEDRHMYKCPYRQQGSTKRSLVYGVHQHIVTGLGLKRAADFVVVDEVPSGAFNGERFVELKNLDAGGGALAKLARRMQDVALSLRGGRVLYGAELMRHVGSEIGELLALFQQDIGQIEPQIPDIQSPMDIFTSNEWYLLDLLMVAAPEYEAWSSGFDDWLPRIFLSKEGLRMLTHKRLWNKLPQKIVALDGTGKPELYESMFGRPVKVVKPQLKMKGRIIQIPNRLNGVGTVLGPKTEDGSVRPLERSGEDLKSLVQIIRMSKPDGNGGFSKYKAIAVGTFKDAVPHFEDVAEYVFYFGGSRGANFLVGEDGELLVDCLVVAGSPSPPNEEVMTLAAQLIPDRIQAFRVEHSPEGPSPVRVSSMVEYNYINAEYGNAPYRVISGFTGELGLVHSLAERDELDQMVHRARPYIYEGVHIYVLTSVPVSEPLWDVWENPHKGLNIPEGITPRQWVQIIPLLAGNTVVTKEMLVEATGASPRTAHDWLKIIEDYSPLWKITRQRGTGGAPKHVLAKATKVK